MNLEQKLRDQNYDLIDGPLRNHREYQLWLDRGASKPEPYKSDLRHVFSSELSLNVIDSDALSVNATDTKKNKFNIGLTVVDGILKSLGLGGLELTSHVSKGSSVEISYDNSNCVEVETGDLIAFLNDADFPHQNPSLLNDLNRNNVLVISGILYAQNFYAKIVTDLEVTEEIKAEIKDILNTNITLEVENASTILLSAKELGKIPIAVKAHRLRFRNGRFIDTKLVTDSAGIFDSNGLF